ncbi:MAG TPA: hypothetical protein PKK97_04335 [Thauera aminoaromatica]|jgi:hypothetical protein|nr:hypothetical protein [Thauera aminoaromatica]HMX14415.1 hypothetical protein [Thauera aminoaromatica]HMY80053.1 hypothetical protein [Thauera aminoaromatica]HMZ30304.1 hypothetical protein [Thauera aminoaromatica]HNB07732.1 hypothetical protein [Thauera aminoaromatica]
MNAKMLSRRAGILSAATVLVSFGISAASAAPPQVVAAAAAVAPAGPVVDNTVATPAPASIQTPLELLLFVHRADLPLRPLPTKQKDHS